MKTQEKSKEIVALEKKTNKALDTARELKVTNDEEMEKAGEFRLSIKSIAKNAKEEKEKATKPLNEALKTIRSWFAPLEENCEAVLEIVDEKMLDYQNRQEEKRRKAETKLDKVAEAPMASSTFHTRTTKGVTFQDPKTLQPALAKKLIDGGYLVWDEVKARRDALNGLDVPGTVIVEQKSLV